MVKPHAKRRHKKSVPICPDKKTGSLKNGNLSGDLSKCLRCGAKTRKGTKCKSPAMKNGRCRMHGGKSTGPKTAEGIERIRQAHLKHGYYSKEAIRERAQENGLYQFFKNMLQKLNDGGNA